MMEVHIMVDDNGVANAGVTSQTFIEFTGPVRSGLRTGSERAYRIALPNGVTVEAPQGFDPGQLSSLLSVVKGSC